jgi:hypothetical protein
MSNKCDSGSRAGGLHVAILIHTKYRGKTYSKGQVLLSDSKVNLVKTYVHSRQAERTS